MKKLFAITAISVLLFAGCSSDDGNDNNGGEKTTTLEIKNNSNYDLLQVDYGGFEFGTIGNGKGATKSVTAGTRSIFFYLQSPEGNVYCRTDDVLTCKYGEDNEWTIIDNTLIENIATGRTRTLRIINDEISMTSSFLELTQNDTIMSQSGVYDFGYLLIDKTSEITFNIMNTGLADLIIEPVGGRLVYLEDNAQGFFNVSQPSVSTLAPGSLTSFKITFSPTAVGLKFNAVVHIKNNSRNNNEFLFTVRGNGRNYREGDVGPAGGYVFYDVLGHKDSIDDGWRFMEVAPASAEFTAQWGASGIDVTIAGVTNPGWELPWLTASIAGSGRGNTDLIAAVLDERGETNSAAQRCKSLVYGGYDDWFLPSIEDFIYIDQYLYRRGLGGFGSGDYWSSSQANSGSAKTFNFSKYTDSTSGKTNALRVRAVRSF